MSSIYDTKCYLVGRSPGLVVLGLDSLSDGHGFESQHRILDGHFFTLICCKYCHVCLKKTENKAKKRMGMAHFFKKYYLVGIFLWANVPNRWRQNFLFHKNEPSLSLKKVPQFELKKYQFWNHFRYAFRHKARIYARHRYRWFAGWLAGDCLRVMCVRERYIETGKDCVIKFWDGNDDDLGWATTTTTTKESTTQLETSS